MYNSSFVGDVSKSQGMDKVIVHVDDFLFDLITRYVETKKKDIPLLEAALAANDAKTLHELAHKIKGVAGMYGFTDLTQIGQKIESAADAGYFNEIPALIKMMSDYLNTVEVRCKKAAV